MAYIINRYNGTVLTSVEDGTINQTTELKFVGKNYSGYGEIQNENFLHLLENFSNPTPPSKAITGQIWFDNSASKLKFYDGIKWRSAGTAEVSNNEPVGLVEGDLWYKASTKQLFAKTNENTYVLIGPQVAGVDVTQLISESVEDTTASSQPIIKAMIDGDTVFVISNSEFTLSTSDAIAGFDVIKRGITLVNTQASTNGVTTNSGLSNEAIIWGTASNSLRLGGRLASEYVTIDSPLFSGEIETNEEGVNINNTFYVYTDGNSGIINVEGLSTKVFVNSEHILSFTSAGMVPSATSLRNLGTNTLKWKEIHVDDVFGNASSATSLRVAGNNRLGSTTSVANTVVVRDASSDVYANLFHGTATRARYADLAEKYTTSQEWPVGTAMAVCSHGDHETCPASAGNVCIGVISENPAYLMNSELENGQAIALKGRVPVRISGPVKKGQAIYAWNDGICTTITTTAFVGVALETNLEEDVKLVECVLKV
jgi:hypothetical protein